MDVNDLFDLLEKKGHEQYGQEAISQLQHALQCATLAKNEQAQDRMIVAALFHDVGHLIADDENVALEGVDAFHENVGYNALIGVFGDDVASPVKLHVLAKRYLCTTDPDYYNGLTQASRTSLEVQGGRLTGDEVVEFESQPYSHDAICLRRWDEAAKVPGAKTADLADFKPIAQRLALSNSQETP